jgi:yecA family protein
MDQIIKHDELEEALARCRADWRAAQVHGLICSRLAVCGGRVEPDWLAEVLSGSETGSADTRECASMLETLYRESYCRLAERQSEFMPLLPDDTAPTASRADALADWCNGFLHGLVSGPYPDRVKSQLASEPISDIIKDMLQITRAAVDEDADDESTEEAYAELVEYIRVAAQLTYEELAGFRALQDSIPSGKAGDIIH